ncbi:MAG: SLC13 family permease [bacterium]|jgi:di/tricarboxylate transporter|nr:SLC13 family permease [bacterium]
MGFDALLTLAAVLTVLGFLIFSSISADAILGACLVFLLLTGILTPDEALKGFSNQGMITVGVLYIVVAGLRETGGIGWIVQRVLGTPKSLFNAQVRLMSPIIIMSAFLNNTPVVAMLIPAVREWAKKMHLPVSRLMIPLSYAAILGGTCTLIGTSTNLVVNGLLVSETTYPSLNMFDIAYVGFPCALVGLVYILVFGRWLLPDRTSVRHKMDNPREYTVEMIVEPQSPLVGRTIEHAGLRPLPGMFVSEIERAGHLIPVVSPKEILQENDRLVFAGIVESVVDLQKFRGLKPATDQVFKLESPRPHRCLIETVVSNTCPLVGQTIRAGRFRSIYNAVIIAVARNGERIHKKIGDIILRPGDTLLLEAMPSFVEQHQNSRDFYLVSRVENSNPPRHEKALLALGILIAMIVVVTVGWISMLKAAMAAALLMIMTGCCSGNEAKSNVDWHVLIVIACSFGIGIAMDKTGLAQLIAGSVIALAGDNPWVILALVYLVTTVFTEMITNNAAAVLVFPIALATAHNLGVNFMPFAIVIMMGASASFATPIGYQTNLMVYGPGGYRFNDFVRIGLPLNILMGIISVALAPLFWPF